MPKSCRECEILKNKMPVRRPVNPAAERARKYRERKKALKNASWQELNISSSIISNTKPKIPAESSDLKRITVGVHQEQENSQPSTSTLPVKKIKTSTEHCPEFGVGEKSLINLTEDIIEDFQTSSNTVNANNNNNTGNNIKLIFVRRPAKKSTQCVRKNRAQKKALNNQASQELNVSSSIISNMDEVKTKNRKRIMKEGTPDVCRACHEPGGSVRDISGCSHLANGLDSGYKIFDDIDIEEHDVLDNPRIKNIFPDITCIKTDVIKYEDEDINNCDEENYKAYQQDIIPDYLEHVPTLCQNKIIVASKPCESTPSEEEEPEILECSIVLEDLGSSLKNNPRFCSDCEILFPTDNSLDSHKMTAHSFLKAARKNKAIKSTTKSSIAARLKFETDSNTEISNHCNHCNKVFPDQKSLRKHSEELLTKQFSCDVCDLLFDSKISLQQHLSSCYFKFTNKKVSHMDKQHQVDVKNVPQHKRTTYRCRFCAKIFPNTQRYSAYVNKIHTEQCKKIFQDKNHRDKFKSQPSKPSAYSEKIHRVSHHANESETSSKSVDLDKHIKTEPLSPNMTQTVLKQEFIRRPVPKSTLFKCSKCQIHFVSSLVALKHSKRCARKKVNWKCKTCRIPFRQVDHHVHKIQHDWTDRFKILTVHENMSNSILCRCVSCKVCSDERTLIRSHERGCPKSISFLCNMCNVNIYGKALTKHIKVHNEMDSESFVVVDFVNFDQSTSSSAIAIKPTIKNVKSKKPAKELKKFKLYYYCPTCRCYMKVKKVSEGHKIGKCKRNLLKRLCELCGLTFSPTCYVWHVKDHKKFPHLKLKDLTFRSTQSGKKVNPPPPYFTKCVNCEVKFYRTLALNNHDCIGDEPKTCGYCGDIFSDFAYKLHVPFHEYAVERNTVVKNERMSDNPDKERAPKVTHRVSQHEIESETYSKSVYLDNPIKMAPLSPKISRRVSQHAIKTYSKSVDLDKQIKIEPPSPTISRRVSQHAIKTYSKSVDLDKQIKIESPSPTISRRVSQHEIESETYSISVDLDKQIKIEPPSPTISRRVSRPVIKTYSKSVNLDKQIKIEPLSPKINQTDLKQEL